MKTLESVTMRQAAKYPEGKAARDWKHAKEILSTIEKEDRAATEEEQRELARLVSFTIHTEGDKMEGFNSCSTSCKDNAGCAARAKIPGSICEKCFAQQQLARYGSLEDSATRNSAILRRVVIAPAVWAEVKRFDKAGPNATATGAFRFESFGDLDNSAAGVTQAVNYIMIAKAFPNVHFAIWTKAPRILAKAFELVGKPANLRAVLSSLYENRVDAIPEGLHKWFDGRFTVWASKAAATAAGVEINCAKHCSTCMKCYTGEGWQEIHELEKKAGNEY